MIPTHYFLSMYLYNSEDVISVSVLNSMQYHPGQQRIFFTGFCKLMSVLEEKLQNISTIYCTDASDKKESFYRPKHINFSLPTVHFGL